MNIDTETIQREADTIAAAPAAYKLMIIRSLRNDTRFADWDDESLAELERRSTTTGEDNKMEVIPFNRNPVTTQLTRRPTVSAAIPETSTQDYMGPFILNSGTPNRTLYSYSWKKDNGQHPPTLLDLKKEVDSLNRSMDWRTRNVRQDGMSLGRDEEGYYINLLGKPNQSPWIEGGNVILRPDEKLYFTKKGVRKFFSQCVNGGISKLNHLEKSFQLNRQAYVGADPNKKQHLDTALSALMGQVSFTFMADNFAGWNSQYSRLDKNHQLLTFVAKNHATGMFRRYVGHTVSSRYNQLKDADFIDLLIESNPDLLEMAIIDCVVTDNVTKLRILDESPEVARKVVESGFKLHTPYKAFDAGNSQNSTRAGWFGGGQFQPDCFNGMHRFTQEGGSVRIRKNMSAENMRSLLSGAVHNVRLDSQNIIESYHESQFAQVSNYLNFMDAARQGYKRRDEDADGRTANPITDKVLEQIKNNINHPTNSGAMYTANADGPPDMGCSAQRIADAVTYTANEAVKQNRLLLACHLQDFGCSIVDEANSRHKEYAETVSDDTVWNGYIDHSPKERSISF